MKRAIDFRAGLERSGQLANLSKALQVASQLKTTVDGRVTLPAGIKAEMRDITRRANAREGGNSTPLTADQQQRVRELRQDGKTLMECAQIMGTTYSRVFKCGY
jgi:hypothetical protein